jgi:hypothetical protein
MAIKFKLFPLAAAAAVYMTSISPAHAVCDKCVVGAIKAQTVQLGAQTSAQTAAIGGFFTTQTTALQLGISDASANNTIALTGLRKTVETVMSNHMREIALLEGRSQVYNTRRYVQENYGGPLPSIVCVEANRGGAMAAGNAGKDEAERTAREKTADRSLDPPALTKSTVDNARLTDEALKWETLIDPEGGVLTPEQEEVLDAMVERVTDWRPVEQPTTAEQQTVNGVALQSVVNERAARLAPTRSILASQASEVKARYDLEEWAKYIDEDVEYPGKEALTATLEANKGTPSEGKISYRMMQDLMVHKRFSNPDYITEVNTMSQKQLMVEMNLQMALNNMIMLDLLRNQQSIARLDASNSSMAIDQATRGQAVLLKKRSATPDVSPSPAQ